MFLAKDYGKGISEISIFSDKIDYEGICIGMAVQDAIAKGYTAIGTGDGGSKSVITLTKEEIPALVGASLDLAANGFKRIERFGAKGVKLNSSDFLPTSTITSIVISNNM